jgi:hypothetical protein
MQLLFEGRQLVIAIPKSFLGSAETLQLRSHHLLKLQQRIAKLDVCHFCLLSTGDKVNVSPCARWNRVLLEASSKFDSMIQGLCESIKHARTGNPFRDPQIDCRVSKIFSGYQYVKGIDTGGGVGTKCQVTTAAALK